MKLRIISLRKLWTGEKKFVLLVFFGKRIISKRSGRDIFQPRGQRGLGSKIWGDIPGSGSDL